MIGEIKKRVEATMCPTYSSDGGDKGVEGRISQSDFNTLVSLLNAKGRLELYRHKKRGTSYAKIGTAVIQTEVWEDEFGNPVDGEKLVLYQSLDDGKYYVRTPEEFEDGRFEKLPDGPPYVMAFDPSKPGSDVTVFHVPFEFRERAAKEIHRLLGADDEEDFGDNESSRWCQSVVDLVIRELTVGSTQRS